MTSASGRLLGGRYELGDLLGYGGMAEVYLGRDVRLNRQVAVKVLRADLARDPSFLTRFRREAQSAASLSHPSIVSVYDTGEDPGSTPPTPFIVMEYVQGPTLRDVLRQEGQLEPRRAAQIVAEVCRALDYAHGQGLVHRDVKPGNVMLDRRGNVKVMDFGIARAATASQATVTATAAVIGTAQYLSPEQARGEHTDGRSDVYSTGCLLYELLTGRPPFTGDSPVAVAFQHVREEPVPPSQIDAELGRDFDTVVLKAMAKSPDDRYGDAGQMAADLDLLAAGRRVATVAARTLPAEVRTSVMPAATSATTVMPRGAGTPLRTPPPQRPDRRPVYIALGVLVAALLIGGGLLAAHQLSGSSAPKQVSLPKVEGLTKTVAEQKLQFLGLNPDESNEHSATIPANTVISQDPQPGLVPASSTVKLVISSGVDQVEVPNVVGFPEKEARAQIVAAGLANTGSIGKIDPSQTIGQVISTNPTGGTAVAKGFTVILTVVSNQTTVPDLSNVDPGNVGATLASADLVLGKTTPQQTSDPTKNGKVLSQSVTAGTTVARKSTVDIVVGQYTPPTTPPATTPVATVTTPAPGTATPTDTTVPTDSTAVTPSATPTAP